VISSEIDRPESGLVWISLFYGNPGLPGKEKNDPERRGPDDIV
jgi:hypothetical protein